MMRNSGRNFGCGGPHHHNGLTDLEHSHMARNDPLQIGQIMTSEGLVHVKRGTDNLFNKKNPFERFIITNAN